MDILLLQNTGEFETAKRGLGNSLKNIEIIAWSPFAIDDLQKNNIKYTSAFDHFEKKFNPDNEISKYKKYIEWCEMIDNHILQLVPEIKNLRIRPFLNEMHSLRMFFFFYISEIDKLKDLIDSLNPEKVFYFNYPYHHFSMLSKLVNIICKTNKWGVDFVRLEDPQIEYKSLLVKNRVIPDRLERDKIWMKIARYVIRKPEYKNLLSLLTGLTCSRLFRKEKYSILILNVHRDIKKILMQLRDKSACDLIFWEDIHVKSPAFLNIHSEKIINELKKDKKTHQWTTINEIDMFDLFIPAIKSTLNNDVLMLIVTVMKFRELNERFKFNLVISGHEAPQVGAIWDQCEDLDIPIAHFLHGPANYIKGFTNVPVSVIGRKNPSKFYYFVYTDAVAEHHNCLKKKFSSLSSNTIPVGSNYFEELVKKGCKIKSKPGDILKICVVYGGFGYANRWVYDDAYLYRLRYNVIEKFKNIPNITLIIKFGYNTEDLGLELDKKSSSGFWKNVHTISSTKKLTEILDVPDLFILEDPSSPLFEVLTTCKPVILHIDHSRLYFTQKAERLLQNRVTIVRSSKELELCIDDIIENGREARVFKQPNPNDNAFINSYATSGWFNNVERAVDKINSILKMKHAGNG